MQNNFRICTHGGSYKPVTQNSERSVSGSIPADSIEVSMITIIISRSKNGVIGKNGNLPWQSLADMQWFKEQTTGHVVIMGRKTWESLYRKPLPNRTNIVVSHLGSSRYVRSHAGALWVNSFIEAVNLALTIDSEIFIIGGAQIYKYALELGIVSRILLTEFYKEYNGDVYCPDFGTGWNIKTLQNNEEFIILEYTK